MSDGKTNLKVVLVTGSTSGIGLVTAFLFQKKGYQVILNSRKEKQSLSPSFQKLIEAKGNIDYITGDVTKEEDVEKIFQYIKKTYGRLDVLVNNTGYSEHKSFIRLNKSSITDMLDGNLTSAVLCSKHAVRIMMTQKSGRIIYVSSTAGLHGMPFEAHYSAAKAGLIGLAKSVAKEYGTKGITSNVIAPGVVDKKDTLHMSPSQEDVVEKIPLRRKGKLGEIAAVVEFMASDNAGYITGQVIQVDGGFYL